MKLLSFHKDKKIKDFYLKRLQAHAEADEFVKGKYWENGKGCAVGCTIHSNDHSLYESEIGIPEWLAKVEDRIFEGLTNTEAKKWPIRFMKSIPVGVDLNKIKIPFLIFIVESALSSFNHIEFPKQKEKIENVLNLLKNNTKNKRKLKSAAAAAYAGYAAAYAGYAADAAAAAYAGYAAAYAGYAADADAAAADAADAAAAAKEKTYKLFSDKLIGLIRELK